MNCQRRTQDQVTVGNPASLECVTCHVVLWVQTTWFFGYKPCGSLGTNHVVLWVQTMWFFGYKPRGSLGTNHVVLWVQTMWFFGYKPCGSLGTNHVVLWVQTTWFFGCKYDSHFDETTRVRIIRNSTCPNKTARVLTGSDSIRNDKKPETTKF